MMKLLQMVGWASVVFVLACWAGQAVSSTAGAGVDPEAYPGLSAEGLGELRFFLAAADGPVEDFSVFGSTDPARGNDYRYSIAFMTYYLALVQYHDLPACPEIIGPRMERLIEKMIAKPAWQYWAYLSQGVPSLEPLYNRPYPESHDPVADQNIMYSGHLGHMIGLYETLYRDFRWDQPDSIGFVWDQTEKYQYDHHSLNRLMFRQMDENPWHGIACEPNAVFPSCNQHPIMSFILHDRLHGTAYLKASDQMLDSFLEHKILNLRTRHFGGYYLVKQNDVVGGVPPAVSPSMDGWAGTFMHVWQPDLIERLYPYQKRYHVTFTTQNQARIGLDLPAGHTLKYGYFAMFAAELGDTDTRDRLLAAAAELFKPVRENGAFYYPIKQEKDRNVTFLTGTLLALARVLPPGGMARLHNQPFGDRHFGEPAVTGVDFPRVLLKRAVYDPDKKALIVSTVPAGGATGTTTFSVVNLDPSASYVLYLDGVKTGEYGSVSELQVELSLDRPHDVALTVSP